jgi:hypothetical protein
MPFRRSHDDQGTESEAATAQDSDVARPVAEWEYKAIAGMGAQQVADNVRKQLETTLNTLACDGWDVVGSSGSVIILKRAVAAPDIRTTELEPAM